MAPPSSGGICLGQIMKMIEPYNVGDYKHNSMEAIQIIVEAERRSYADRSLYLGDPDFVKIPQNELLQEKYLSDHMKSLPSKEHQNQLIFCQGQFHGKKVKKLLIIQLSTLWVMQLQ